MSDTITQSEVAVGVLQRAIDAWNAKDIEAYLSLMAADVVWDDAGAPQILQGREAVREWTNTALRAFPDFRIHVLEPFFVQDGGERVAVHYQIEATMDGPMEPPGFAPTHRHVSVDAIDLVEVRDGLITRITSRFDTLRVAEQVGMLPTHPAPGSSGEKIAVLLQTMIAPYLSPPKKK